MEYKARALKMMLSATGYAGVTISGVSMWPVLQDGQKAEVVYCSQYEIGDILVYGYKSEGILVHRLLKIENGIYFCKGDNSFRLEAIIARQVIGKVKIKDDRNNNINFVVYSLRIAKLFRYCNYDVDKTKQQSEYVEYCQKYLNARKNIQ